MKRDPLTAQTAASREYARRRRHLMELMGSGGIAVLPAAPARRRSRDTNYEYRQDSDFFYLTGSVGRHPRRPRGRGGRSCGRRRLPHRRYRRHSARAAGAQRAGLLRHGRLRCLRRAPHGVDASAAEQSATGRRTGRTGVFGPPPARDAPVQEPRGDPHHAALRPACRRCTQAGDDSVQAGDARI